MKFLSVFTKAPKHQRFNFTPRFYDAQKEEMQERENRIRLEVEKQRGEVKPEESIHRTRIAGSFRAARKRSNPEKATGNAVMIRLAVLLFITVLLIAYIEFGPPALYAMILFVPFYLYLKFKDN